MSNSEEVDQFLQRMRTMSDLRDSQDAERVKKLEEELIQGRSERLARRAERARSLSPDKPTTPQPSSAADTADSVQEKAAHTPTPTMEPAQVLQDEEPKKPAPSASALARSGTLSWQQRRPQSGGIRRPLSLASPTVEAPPASSPELSPEAAPSRDQIAESLSAKDPSWFKQTSDRGVGSAAYRRSQDNTPSEAGSVSGKRQLPGMSRESTVEAEATSPPPESVRSIGSNRGSTILGNRLSNTAASGGDIDSANRVKSPLPFLESQKFAPPSEQGSSVDGGDHERPPTRGLAMSPSQVRILPERERAPTSPTKGMGGFVQSAMLKRSDSVSKRWSAQTPAPLSRQNSTLSNRGSTHGTTVSRLETRPSTLSRDNSMEPSSRPASSSSNLPMSRDTTDGASGDEFVKPALPRHSRSKSVVSTFSDSARQHDETSATSPTKKWSPTKSSWLESALSKPESPKIKQAPPQQPAWMTEISRIKQQRGSVDMGKASPLHSPPADSQASGRTSPIKDIQLRPVGLRRPESPKKEEHPSEPESTKAAQSSPKPKPAISPKASLTTNPEPSAAEESSNNTNDAEVSMNTHTDSTPRPSSSTARFSRDAALSPPATKPKPETPLKKDFRANLRSRNTISDDSKKNEVSELQSVFDKLKKTETKNYVAPDTFKDNILRGKRGLSVTGGPRPYVHRDEFRDSLVTQKTAMLAKAQETGSAALKRNDSSSKPGPTPEALAMRKNLGRSDSISKVPPPPKEKAREATPEALVKIQSLRANKNMSMEKPAEPDASSGPKEIAKSNKFADRFNPGLAGLLARGPPPMAKNPGASEASASEAATRSTSEEKPGPAPELTHMTKGRARGPKRRTPTSKQSATTNDSSQSTKPIDATVEEKEVIAATVSSAKAEHVLPSPQPESFKTNNASEDLPVTKTPVRDSLKAKPVTPAKSPQLSQKLEKPPSPELTMKPRLSELENKTTPGMSLTPKKSPLATAVDSPQPSPSPSVKSSRPLPTPSSKPVSSPLQEIFPPNNDSSSTNDDGSPEKSNFSVRNASASWGRQSASSSPAPAPVKPPIILPTKADEEAAMENAGLRRNIETPDEILQAQPKPQAPKPKPIGLGLAGVVSAKFRVSSPPKPLSAKPSPISPPTTGDRPQSEPFKVSPAPEKPQGIFDDFFDEPPVTTGQLPDNIDALHVLQNPPFDFKPSGKIRTLRKQIHEVTGDGKLMSIPMQEEHVLYQDSMYLCIHTFGDSKGARVTEAYLWSGDDVAEPTVEDVQVFARNHAKQNQAKLVHMRQGKETPNFFDALGGIVITRRARPAPKEYMLCGRRHLGHIAFDEVDYSLKSLCSGYAYIISAGSGRMFLWKGRGCSQEELSAARLMGMDLASSGEILEVDEGAESQDFMQIFPPVEGKGPAIPRSADHWRYKATADRYRPRLFKIEQQQASGWGSLQTPTTPKSPPSTSKVVEIMPFCQRDMEPEYIYVLDAFFETYIIVGSLARSQAAAFSTALMFVQEYTMLAVSEEDRPFMPISTIVLEGTPRDMKAVFRFWSDAMIPAAGLMSGKLGRGKSLRIVGLEKAIEATRR